MSTNKSREVIANGAGANNKLSFNSLYGNPYKPSFVAFV
jgi:hypothetical protein